MNKESKLELDNGFFQIKIKPDAYALGEYFAGMNSGDQVRFLKGFVSEFESLGKVKWALQASYIADELNTCNYSGVSVFKPFIIDYLETLLEQLKQE